MILGVLFYDDGDDLLNEVYQARQRSQRRVARSRFYATAVAATRRSCSWAQPNEVAQLVESARNVAEPGI